MAKLLKLWYVVAVLKTAEAFSSFAMSSVFARCHLLPALTPEPSEEKILVVRYAKPERDAGDESRGEDDDWRTFRAKLVMSEGGTPTPASSQSSNDVENSADSSVDDADLDGFGALFSENFTPSSPTTAPSSIIPGFTPLEPSQWAYYSGKVIEQGSVILGGVEQDFGFGLRQQYFHKAVILVLDHDESTFTKGIILNRPSGRVLEDDVNEGLQWKVWFGGDVQGLDSLLPEIVCLHSLRSNEAREASVSVMKDIQVSSDT